MYKTFISCARTYPSLRNCRTCRHKCSIRHYEYVEGHEEKGRIMVEDDNRELMQVNG